MDTKKILEAGRIASEVRKYAKTIIKKDVPLLEIAEKIEAKIKACGGKPAFPVNLSIDNISAHYTPSHDDKTLAHGLLKVDFGVHIDGWIADTAFSINLEESEENGELITAAEQALNKALELIKDNGRVEGVVAISTDEIGDIISKTIESYGFSPIINLSGHNMGNYKLHSGITIPNVNDHKKIKFVEGVYAFEPFATTGSGKVHDGKPSEIYELRETKNVRNPISREVLELIKKEYNTLPFCSRWLVKKLGTRALFGLKQLEDNGNLHQFAQLVEVAGSKVSQAEQTILISDDKVIVTTE